MARAGQAEKARRFREEHEGDGVLVLPNAWDPGSARVFEAEGFPAIGTTSAGVAFAAGRPDGGLGRAEMVAAVGRIAAAVQVPVSADIEAGFGDDAAAVGETVAAVIEAGAIGINLEDAAPGEERALVDLDEQLARIGAARDAAENAGIALFVNARTDVFWLGLEGEELLETAIERLSAYVDAGADGAFVPRLVDADGIRRIAAAVPAPLNVLAAPGMPPLAELRSLGARRLSTGSSPARAALALTRRIAAELHEDGASRAMGEATIPYPEANRLFGSDADDM
jgi:2-methylisocitrate lyase-like PEP mutase family enzyme